MNVDRGWEGGYDALEGMGAEGYTGVRAGRREELGHNGRAHLGECWGAVAGHAGRQRHDGGLAACRAEKVKLQGGRDG